MYQLGTDRFLALNIDSGGDRQQKQRLCLEDSKGLHLPGLFKHIGRRHTKPPCIAFFWQNNLVQSNNHQ